MSDRDADQRRAARLCFGCAAVAACRAFIDRHPAEAGTYAGSTEKDRKARTDTPMEATE